MKSKRPHSTLLELVGLEAKMRTQTQRNLRLNRSDQLEFSTKHFYRLIFFQISD